MMNTVFISESEKKLILNNAPEEEPERQYYFIEQCRNILEIIKGKKGRGLTACINTFGCQMNGKDSEKLAGVLSLMGYKMSDDENSDFVLYNTCTVREHANKRVYGRLGVLKNYKQDNQDMIIALCGCMMQEPAVVEKIKKSFRYVDIIFGTHNIYKLAELVFLHLSEKSMQVEILDEPLKTVENLPSIRKYDFKASINIMYGCDNFCSYCIVPYVRGRERSRLPSDILREVKNLADNGVKEIMLLGQNVNSYGKQFILADDNIKREKRSDEEIPEYKKQGCLEISGQISFAQLLCEIEKIDGIKRVRFMTSHPKDLSDELIEVIKNSDKICKHIHLPLQSGSNRILSAMNRKYSKDDYIRLADRIRLEIPDVSITTDIIVGFPTETEEDFNDTLEVVKKVKFDSAFTFIYSKRNGTKAATMEGQIPEEITKDRFSRLLNIVNKTASEQTFKYEGSIADVLAEEINPKDSDYLTGRTSNNFVVHFKGNQNLIGHIVSVRLSKACGFYFIGEIL